MGATILYQMFGIALVNTNVYYKFSETDSSLYCWQRVGKTYFYKRTTDISNLWSN